MTKKVIEKRELWQSMVISVQAWHMNKKLLLTVTTFLTILSIHHRLQPVRGGHVQKCTSLLPALWNMLMVA